MSISAFIVSFLYAYGLDLAMLRSEFVAIAFGVMAYSRIIVPALMFNVLAAVCFDA